MHRAARPAVLAAIVAAVLVAAALVAGGAGAARAAVRPAAPEAAWVEQVSSICHRIGIELQKVPAPVSVGSTLVLGNLAAQALPLLARQQREVRAVKRPASLQARVDALLADDDGAVLALRHLLAAAKAGNLKGAQRAFVVFLAAQSSARARSLALGIRC